MKSKSHNESVMKVRHIKKPGIGAQLDMQFAQGQQLHRRMLMKQLSSLRYLLRQGSAIRGHDPIEGNLMQLLLLRAEDCAELNQWVKDKHYLSSEILTEMISLMGRKVTLQLLEDIHASP